MLHGLGIATSQAPLTAEQEDLLDRFFVFISAPLSEYDALPKEDQEPMAAMCKTWQLTKLTLTRTATKKQ